MKGIIFVLAVYFFAQTGYFLCVRPEDETLPIWADTKAILNLALEAKTRLVLGDGNRHALFPLFLSFFVSPNSKIKDNIQRMKAASFVLTLACVIALYFFLKNLSLWLICVFFVILPKASYPIVEPIFYALTLVIFIKQCKFLRGEKQNLFLVGALCGFAYLAKATAFIQLCLFLPFLYNNKIEAGKFLVGFLLLSWPQLLWNYIIFGNPIYSVNTSFLSIYGFKTGFMWIAENLFSPGNYLFYGSAWLVIAIGGWIYRRERIGMAELFGILWITVIFGMSLCYSFQVSRFYLLVYMPALWLFWHPDIDRFLPIICIMAVDFSVGLISGGLYFF